MLLKFKPSSPPSPCSVDTLGSLKSNIVPSCELDSCLFGVDVLGACSCVSLRMGSAGLPVILFVVEDTGSEASLFGG